MIFHYCTAKSLVFMRLVRLFVAISEPQRVVYPTAFSW